MDIAVAPFDRLGPVGRVAFKIFKGRLVKPPDASSPCGERRVLLTDLINESSYAVSLRL